MVHGKSTKEFKTRPLSAGEGGSASDRSLLRSQPPSRCKQEASEAAKESLVTHVCGDSWSISLGRQECSFDFIP